MTPNHYLEPRWSTKKQINLTQTSYKLAQKMIGGVMYGPGNTKRLIKHDKETLA
jgi:hypothetical protein